MYWLGVTGSIGAGKSVFCDCAAELGWHVFDCDVINRKLISQPHIAQELKLIIRLDQNTPLDILFKELRRRLANSLNLRLRLESFLHPLIVRELLYQIDILKEFYKDNLEDLNILVCLPVLSLYVSTYLEQSLNHKICIETHRNFQQQRLLKRYGKNEKNTILNLINIHDQMEEYRHSWVGKKSNILWNNGTEAHWKEYSTHYLIEVKDKFPPQENLFLRFF